MVLDINLQLNVVMKALRDAVGPAVDPGNKMAVEQLQLSIATLNMVIDRLPLVRKCVRRALADTIEMAERISELDESNPLDPQVTRARAALLDPALDNEDLDVIRQDLLSRVTALFSHERRPDARRAMARAIVAASKPQTDMARAWCVNSGFELDPSVLPKIEAILDVP
ncbi:hypothetical protein KFK14_07330 [Sphingobium phenoxybenzoativorans]|uniref:Uncharacterized protein n=1 Tax=Sphingobium phenoxybenzoativorans TaxID=1592790 RepID=A0A975K9C9_9SPHN|nr:hypothetical protein [Sphingobium phenoxybenzoativorans]QUT07214.1 hypothetical protein KFK14_07330 [Sphingobium phenoxybenzoativorans]